LASIVSLSIETRNALGYFLKIASAALWDARLCDISASRRPISFFEQINALGEFAD